MDALELMNRYKPYLDRYSFLNVYKKMRESRSSARERYLSERSSSPLRSRGTEALVPERKSLGMNKEEIDVKKVSEMETRIKELEEKNQILESKLGLLRRKEIYYLPEPPVPGLNIRDEFVGDRNTYARSHSSYIFALDKIKDPDTKFDYGIECCTLVMGYLYNVKNIEPLEGQTPDEYFQMCADEAPGLIAKLDSEAKKKGMSVRAIIAEESA